MAKNEMSYSEAIAEIEAVLERFNNEEFDIDTLAAEVKKATELIDMCKARLRKAEEDVTNVLKEDK